MDRKAATGSKEPTPQKVRNSDDIKNEFIELAKKMRLPERDDTQRVADAIKLVRLYKESNQPLKTVVGWCEKAKLSRSHFYNFRDVYEAAQACPTIGQMKITEAIREAKKLLRPNSARKNQPKPVTLSGVTKKIFTQQDVTLESVAGMSVEERAACAAELRKVVALLKADVQPVATQSVTPEPTEKTGEQAAPESDNTVKINDAA